MQTSSLIIIVLAAGLASQWLAALLRLPGIVILIPVGIVLGPVTGIISMQTSSSELIGLGVAIILFEGGMDLKLGELKKAGPGVIRLVTLGGPITWALTAVAAHFIVGLAWPVALVLGAIMIVTGPTVIQPILRYARLNDESASLLKWEGIVNDPIGVLLAVLTFQYFTLSGEGAADTALALGGAVVTALVLGGGGGWLVGRLYRRGGVPEHLKPPLLMVLVLLVHTASNQVQHEAGLLSVTLMGMVLGNMKLSGRDDLRRFKENLTVVLVSVLFIMITARLELEHLQLLDWRAWLLVAAVLFAIRPLAVTLSTAAARMRTADRYLLAWIAPRGIVAAATAGLFGPAMLEAGFEDAAILLPLVFAIIIVTVLVHGFTIGTLGRRLGLAAPDDNGVLIIGACPWSIALGLALKDQGVEVLMVDGVYSRLKNARMRGLAVFYGEVLSEHADHELETQHLGLVLCATPNDFYNALVCKALGGKFGRHRTFQLPTRESSSDDERRLTADQRGQIVLDGKHGYDWLEDRMKDGWEFRSAKLSAQHDLATLTEKFDARAIDWLPVAAISAEGQPQLFSSEQPFQPEQGWKVIHFSAPQSAGQSTVGKNSSSTTDRSDDTLAT